jgi:hypothetical protein
VKARQKAQARWSRNPRKPFYAKHAGKARWIDGDTKPRIPGGGPKRK